MCTVTFFPLNGKMVLTSNRDEKPDRSALELHHENGVFYPKDAIKNGTWFAATAQGNAVVLLNGAFENHIRKATYRKSRGLIVLDLISKENIYHALQELDLQDIEPFTLVLLQKKVLSEFRWDGEKKFYKNLENNLSYIWSSATLYDETAREKRAQIFHDFLQNEGISEDAIWDFHHLKSDDLQNGITIKRQNSIQTISTTQVLFSDKTRLKHQNRLTPNVGAEEILLKNET